MSVILEPWKLSQSDQGVMASILDEWISEAREARLEKETDWRSHIRAYAGKPRVEQKSWPWSGSSNIEVPLKAIHTDSILSRIHNSIYRHEKIARAYTEDTRPDVIEAARDIDDFINFEAKNRVELKARTKGWEFDSVLLGTGFLKGMWLDERRIQFFGGDGEEPRAREIFDHYGPYFDRIYIEDMLVPASARAINGPFRCLFVDHISQLRWDELKSREQVGYENVEQIRQEAYSRWGMEIKTERDRLRGIERLRRDEFDIHEIWGLFPCYELERYPHQKVRTAEGMVERDFVELAITYHKESRTLLRVVENWNEMGIRPFWALQYIKDEGSVYGIGVGAMLHGINEAINTCHNQRIDNRTVANTRMWAVRKGAVPRGSQITPSKIFYVDDPKSDIVPLQAGEVYQSAYADETVLKHYGELRTGVSDYQMGREAQGQYQATATSTLRLLEQGNIRWDFTLDDWRETWGHLFQWLLSQYRQYGYANQGLLEREFGQEKAERIKAALSLLSDEPTYALYKFDLVAVTASDSKEAELAKAQVLFDITERFYGQLLTIIGSATRGVDEAGVPITEAQKELIYEAVQAGMALFRKILHSFDIKDVDSYLPSLEALEQAAQKDEVIQGARRLALAASPNQGALPGGAGPGAPGGAPGGARPPEQAASA